MQLGRRDRYQTVTEFIAALNSVSEVSVDEDITEVHVESYEKFSAANTISGHEYVDLGLSVKWATCNVGADNPEDYGDYFAWGETKPKSSYTEDNSDTYGKDMGSIAGNSTYDAARANWGSTWRLPTKDEMEELVRNCTIEWTTYNGVKGRRVTSKKNGNSIFLPAAGYRAGVSLCNEGKHGNYWGGATPDEIDELDAYCFFFRSDNFYSYWFERYEGRSVRPVSE